MVGMETHKSAGMPYTLSSRMLPIDTIQTDPFFQSRMWSRMALAADIDELMPLAPRILPPRFWIMLIYQSSTHSLGSSLVAASPLTVQQVRSGNCVREWFPHIITDFISLLRLLVFMATWLTARLKSRRVRQLKLHLGMEGALLAIIRQLVLAGLATTRIRQVFLAQVLRDLPCSSKTLRLQSKRSLRSIPGFLEAPPMSMAKSSSSKASSGLEWMVTLRTSWKQQSSSSMRRTRRSFIFSGSSNSRRLNSTLVPNTSPVPSELQKL